MKHPTNFRSCRRPNYMQITSSGLHNKRTFTPTQIADISGFWPWVGGRMDLIRSNDSLTNPNKAMHVQLWIYCQCTLYLVRMAYDCTELQNRESFD